MDPVDHLGPSARGRAGWKDVHIVLVGQWGSAKETTPKATPLTARYGG